MIQWFIDKLLGIDRVALGDGEWDIFWRNAPLTWILILVIIPLVLFFAYYFYRRENPNTSITVKIILIGLRSFLIFLLLIIIFQPVLIIETMIYRNSKLIVLLDDSLSMSFESKFSDSKQRKKLEALIDAKTNPLTKPVDEMSRLDLAESVLTKTYGTVLGKLAEKYNVRLYTFSNQLVNRELSDLTAIKPLGEGTAIGDAVSNLMNTLAGESIAGIILISDGQNNIGNDPLNSVSFLANKGNMPPIWVIPAGSQQEVKDIELMKLQALPVGVINDFIEFKFSIRSIGFDNETFPVMIKQGDQNVAEEQVKLIGGNREQEVVLKYKPGQPGEYLCEIILPVQKGELVKENNTLRHYLKVIDDKIKVLYIETYPRWEYRALKNALIRDHTIKASCWLIESDAEFPQESSPGIEPLKYLSLDKKDLFNYDVIIIGDVNPMHLAEHSVTGSSFTDAAKIMENITSFVSEMGGGIAFIAGDSYNPKVFKGTPFAELLPVTLDDDYANTGIDDKQESFHIKLTPQGKLSPIMQLDTDQDLNAALWEESKKDSLPEFWWFHQIKQAKPGAEVLATHPTLKNKYGLYPVFATQWYGGGRVFFSATDETWRWRAFVGDKYFYSFWSEVIRYLRGGRLTGNKRYNIKLDKAAYFLGEKIKIHAKIYDDEFRPLETNSIVAHLELSGGLHKEIELKPVLNSPGVYENTYKTIEVGEHWAWIGPEGLGKESERALASFSVSLPMREFENPVVNTYLLEQIAKKTNGSLIPLYEIDSLLKKVKPTGNIVLTETKEKDLWDSPLIILLFILAITTEWIIRKVVKLL
jgi:uncharacterized membrane protein